MRQGDGGSGVCPIFLFFSANELIVNIVLLLLIVSYKFQLQHYNSAIALSWLLYATKIHCVFMPSNPSCIPALSKFVARMIHTCSSTSTSLHLGKFFCFIFLPFQLDFRYGKMHKLICFGVVSKWVLCEKSDKHYFNFFCKQWLKDKKLELIVILEIVLLVLPLLHKYSNNTNCNP